MGFIFRYIMEQVAFWVAIICSKTLLFLLTITALFRGCGLYCALYYYTTIFLNIYAYSKALADIEALGSLVGLSREMIVWEQTSRKHAHIILTPLNPTFI